MSCHVEITTTKVLKIAQKFDTLVHILKLIKSVIILIIVLDKGKEDKIPKGP